MKKYILLNKVLVFLHIVFDGYFFILIPLNLLADSSLKLFNSFFFAAVALAQLPYRFRCPMTVLRNKIKQKINPDFKPIDSFIAEMLNRLGFKKISLRHSNILMISFGILVFISFFI